MGLFRSFQPRKKFTWLLSSSSFRTMEYKLAMSVLDPRINFSDMEPASLPTRESSYLFNHVLSGYSMDRLTDYVNNLIDFLAISYLEPILATLYFEEKLPVTLSYTQASVLLCMGLQRQELSYVEITLRPHEISLDEDLNDGAKQVMNEMKAKTDDATLNPEHLQKYAIEVDCGSALNNGSGKIPSSGLVNVKSSRSAVEKQGKRKESQNKDKKKHGSRSNKKRKKS